MRTSITPCCAGSAIHHRRKKTLALSVLPSEGTLLGNDAPSVPRPAGHAAEQARVPHPPIPAFVGEL